MTQLAAAVVTVALAKKEDVDGGSGSGAGSTHELTAQLTSLLLFSTELII